MDYKTKILDVKPLIDYVTVTTQDWYGKKTEHIISKIELKRLKREIEGPEIVNGHILKECNCGKCPICDWDAQICSKCNEAEGRLFKYICRYAKT